MQKMALLVLIVLCALFAQAQQAGHLVRHYTDEDGLPQNSIKAIAADEHGFVWLTTEDGLVRFDGRHFLNYTQGQLGLRTARFTTFAKSSSGNGLYAINIAGECVKIENGTARRSRVLPNLQLNYFFDEGTRAHRQRARSINSMPDIRLLNNPHFINASFAVNNGSYRYHRDTVFYYAADNNTIIGRSPFVTRTSTRFFTIGNKLYHLGTDGSVICFDGQRQTAMTLSGDICHTGSGTSPAAHIDLYWNNGSDHVLLYQNRSFYLARPDATGRTLHTTAVLRNVALPTEGMVSFYYDEAIGRLYLGHKTNGLYVIDRQHFRVLTAPKDNVYYGQIPYGPNAILTAPGTILYLSGESKPVPAMKQIGTDPYSLASDRQGNTWYKNGNRLYKFAAGLSTATQSWQLHAYIALLHAGKSGKLWIGMRDSALYTLDLNRPRASPQLYTYLPSPVTALLETSEGLYAGTGNQLYLLEHGSKQAQRVGNFAGKIVSFLLPDTVAGLWIATHGHGLFLLRDGHVYGFPLDAGRSLVNVHSIVADRQGYLWLSTNKGLFQMARADLLAYTRDSTLVPYYQYYDKKDGLFTNEFNGNSAPNGMMLPGGIISFPSMNGLVVFDPAHVKPTLPAAPLFIDKTELNEQEIGTDKLSALPRHFKQLQFTVSTPYMGHPANLHLEYALLHNGSAPLWVPVPEDGTITFTNLPSGRFELRVRKQKGFGAGNFVVTSSTFSVVPAWFETRWFYTGVAVMLLAIVWLVIRLRVRIVQKRNHELEQMVLEKTGELRRQTLAQNRILRAISHDVQTPLRYQVLIADMIKEAIATRELNNLTEPVNVLRDGMHQLDHMIGNLLGYMKLQNPSNATYNPEPVQLHLLVAEKLSLFEPVSSQNGTVIDNKVPVTLQVNTDRQMLAIIIHNLLDNAVKVTLNGRVQVTASVAEQRCTLTIGDTGPGLPVPLIQWFNSKEDMGVDDTMLRSPGMGLVMVKEIAAQLGLSVSVSAAPAQGTVFTIICPV
jgi:signal transduction histidine kinase